MTFPVAPLKTLGAVRVSNVDKHTVDGHAAVRLCNYVDVYKNETVVDDMAFMEATATQDQIKAFRLRPGDTVFTKDSETADDIGIPAYIASAGDDLICGYHLAIFRPRPDRIVPRFAFWAMKSGPVMARWETTATGVTRVGLKSSDIRKLPLPVPPLTEQRAIADYLDRETAKIDTLIKKQTTMIERLREQRAALSENVLAPFVGSGTRLRFLVRERDHRAGTRAQTLPLLSVSIATGVSARTEDNRQAASEDLSRYKIARCGDIVINRMRAFQGGLGVSPSDGIVSPDYAVLGVAGDTDPAWMGAVMRTTSFVAEMSARLRGIGTSEGGQVRTPRINVVDLLNIRMDVPSRSEQATILAILDRETAKIDTLIAKVERHIELAKERRAALITAAVTGQIDVTTSTQSGDAA